MAIKTLGAGTKKTSSSKVTSTKSLAPVRGGPPWLMPKGKVKASKAK